MSEMPTIGFDDPLGDDASVWLRSEEWATYLTRQCKHFCGDPEKGMCCDCQNREKDDRCDLCALTRLTPD